MATAIHEPNYNAEFLIHEIDKRYTRARNEVFKAQATFTKPGTPLGRETRGEQTVTGAAVAGNTTDDTIGGVSASPVAKAGDWAIVGVASVTNAGTFHVFRPDGAFDGAGKVGVAYDSKANGGIAFTIADGAADMAPGDRFKVTVSYAAGSKKLVPLDLASVAGADKFVGYLVNAIEASDTDTRNPVVLVRGDAEVDRALVVYPAGATADQKADIEAQAAALRIYTRASQ